MKDTSSFQDLSLIEQLGHVGAEVHRAGKWEQKHDFESRNKALERAIELLDRIHVEKRQSHRNNEISRLRSVLSNCYVQSQECGVSLSELEEYFLTLAIYMKLNRADSGKSGTGNKLN